MSRINNRYRRVLKRFSWEYLKLEMEVGESHHFLQQLKDVDVKLSSDIEELLAIENTPQQLIFTDQRQNMLAIASELALLRRQNREQIDENRFRLTQLKRRMLLAKNRVQHVTEKSAVAELAGQNEIFSREMNELNDQFASNQRARSRGTLSEEIFRGARDA